MLLELLASGGDAISPLDPNAANLKAGIWALGIFLVVLLVLWKAAWGPILAGLQAREDRIEESLSKAAEIEKNTREMAEINQKLIAEAQTEAQAIVAASREAATRASEVVAEKAQEEIEAQRVRFQNEMRLETDKARSELRQAAAELTVEATTLLLGRALTGADQQRLVEDALKDAESVA